MFAGWQTSCEPAKGQLMRPSSQTALQSRLRGICDEGQTAILETTQRMAKVYRNAEGYHCETYNRDGSNWWSYHGLDAISRALWESGYELVDPRTPDKG